MIGIRIAMLLLALLPAAVFGSAQLYQLQVRLHDAAGIGVAGVTIDLRDHASGQTRATARTNARGEATFAAVPPTALRIVITGQLADGTTLTQPGEDSDGIAFFPNGAPSTLALRIEDDGTVLPDPETMIAPDVGVPQTDEQYTPTRVPFPTQAPLLQAPLLQTPAPAVLIDANGAPVLPDDKATATGWLLLVLAGGALLAVIAIFFRLRRHL